LKDGGGSGGFRDAHSMFADLFGFGGGFGGFGGGGGSRGPRRTQDIRFKLDIALSDFYKGTTKKLRVKRDVICIECAGRGSKTDGAVTQCDQCHGTGVQVMIRRIGPGMIQQMQTRCEKCNGQKEMIAEKDKCVACEGKKVVKQEKVLEVHVEPGMKEGQTIKFREAADQAPGAETGDIIVILVEKKDGEGPEGEKKDGDEPKEVDGDDDDESSISAGAKASEEGKSKKRKKKKKNKSKVPRPAFKRLPNGVDLVIDHELTLTEALLGYEIAIRHLDDRIIIIKSQDNHVTSPNDIVFVEGEGMPLPKRSSEKGDLYIKMTIAMPTAKDLGSESNRKQLRALLPKIPPSPLDPTKEKDSEQYTAKAFDEAAQNAKREKDREQARSRRSYENEDEDEEGGHTASCRTQ